MQSPEIAKERCKNMNTVHIVACNMYKGLPTAPDQIHSIVMNILIVMLVTNKNLAQMQC